MTDRNPIMEPKEEEEEEEEERRSHGHHIHRKLNFNAPLLTTRRPVGNSTGLKLTDRKVTSVSERVPFSWEKAPGKPKDCIERHESATTPRPTLPPSWWRPPLQTTAPHEHETSRNLHRRRNEAGDGFEDSYSVDGYVLSDDEDVFSLSEAIDIVEKAEKRHRFSDDMRLKYEEEEEEEERRKRYNESSNFMIERFLPDATALAASSAVNHGEYSWGYTSRGGSSPETAAGKPFSPAKGCGLDVLFPWRTKQHQLCGVKSPVRHSSQSVGSKSSAKQKKQH